MTTNKRIIDEKELNSLIKKAHDKGIVYGTQVATGVVLKKLSEMTHENFEEKKKELVKFCNGVLKV